MVTPSFLHITQIGTQSWDLAIFMLNVVYSRRPVAWKNNKHSWHDEDALQEEYQVWKSACIYMIGEEMMYIQKPVERLILINCVMLIAFDIISTDPAVKSLWACHILGPK